MTKIMLTHEMLKQNIPKSHIAKRLKVSRRTVIRWSQGIDKYGGIKQFLEHHQNAKKGPRKSRKTDAILKRRIWAIREKYHDCCGQKVQYFLGRDYGTQSKRYYNLQSTGRKI